MIQKVRKAYNSSPGKIFTAFADQGLLSAANFTFGILVIKLSSKQDYGLYVLAYSVIMLAVGLQNALVNTQVTVLSPQKKSVERRQFTFSLYFGQYLYWIPLTLLTLVVFLFLRSQEALSFQTSSLILTTTATTFIYFLREYNRTISFLNLEPFKVLLQDFVFVFVWFCSFFLLVHYFPEKAYFLLAVSAIGVASLIISLIMTVLYVKDVTDPRLQQKAALKECWANGKWSLLGVIITRIEAQSYVYLLSFLKGVENTASANAARQFFMPIVLLSVSFGRIFRPKWAIVKVEGKGTKVLPDATKEVAVIVTLILAYTILVSLAAKTVIPLVFTKEYFDSIPYLLIWAIYFSLNIAVTTSSLVLQVYEKFKQITYVSAVTATVTVLSTFFCVEYFGGYGSIVSMCLGQFLLLILLKVQVGKIDFEIQPRSSSV
ncbi:MAG: lipopolysaccharide biosynthesis protein [Nitrospinota bacterium]